MPVCCYTRTCWWECVYYACFSVNACVCILLFKLILRTFNSLLPYVMNLTSILFHSYVVILNLYRSYKSSDSMDSDIRDVMHTSNVSLVERVLDLQILSARKIFFHISSWRGVSLPQTIHIHQVFVGSSKYWKDIFPLVLPCRARQGANPTAFVLINIEVNDIAITYFI